MNSWFGNLRYKVLSWILKTIFLQYRQQRFSYKTSRDFTQLVAKGESHKVATKLEARSGTGGSFPRKWWQPHAFCLLYCSWGVLSQLSQKKGVGDAAVDSPMNFFCQISVKTSCPGTKPTVNTDNVLITVTLMRLQVLVTVGHSAEASTRPSPAGPSDLPVHI